MRANPNPMPIQTTHEEASSVQSLLPACMEFSVACILDPAKFGPLSAWRNDTERRCDAMRWGASGIGIHYPQLLGLGKEVRIKKRDKIASIIWQ